jgi:thiol-disulfide isomerase/thioredoxin
MSKTNARLLAAACFSLAALLLSSCASVGALEPSAPETSASESPSPSDNSNDSAGAYVDYASYAISADEYADTKVVLFFNAVWCSTCKLARDNFEASLAEIPSDLTIVVVDFDDSIELRKKYGVTVQHTFVQIDSSGEIIGKWSGSVTIAEVKNQLA